jgi:methylthioribose-1-phosphate isomerase
VTSVWCTSNAAQLVVGVVERVQALRLHVTVSDTLIRLPAYRTYYIVATVQAAASHQGATSNSVNTAFITAAAAMLELDITANKQQGHYGVEAIKQDCAHLLNSASTSSNKSDDSKVISVLTHCNTGSLACAGYGTALGVIRTLHAQDMLKACYACETRYVI